MAQVIWPAGQSPKSLLAILGVDMVPSYQDGLLTIDVDQADLDAAVVEFNNDPEQWQLRPVRLLKQRAVINKAATFVASRYPAELQTMYIALMVDALIQGLPNRVAYIGQLLQWVKDVSQKSIEAEVAIGEAGTVEEIKAVEINLDAVDLADPQTTIKAALEIND